jgi:hypothetical protein
LFEFPEDMQPTDENLQTLSFFLSQTVSNDVQNRKKGARSDVCLLWHCCIFFQKTQTGKRWRDPIASGTSRWSLVLSTDWPLLLRIIATEELEKVSTQQGFPILLLMLIQNQAVAPAVKQSAAVYFKNFAKQRWTPQVSTSFDTFCSVRFFCDFIRGRLPSFSHSPLRRRLLLKLLLLYEISLPTLTLTSL